MQTKEQWDRDWPARVAGHSAQVARIAAAAGTTTNRAFMDELVILVTMIRQEAIQGVAVAVSELDTEQVL